jgi:hypothetical protein
MAAMWKSILVLLGITLALTAVTKTPINQEQTTPTAKPSGDLKYKTPEGWAVDKPSSAMRVAQYKLPKAAGDTEDGLLVLYYFGERQGGTTQANIDRWIGQMQQPDGSTSKDKSKSEALTINGLKVTTVDVSGTYVAETAPGSGTFTNNPGYRLRAAVVETPKGSYYVKLIGPQKTIGQWGDSFTAYLNSFEFK